MLRAYRRNEYDIEGYVIETGLTFIISVDYNTLNKFFKEKRRQKHQRRNQPIPQPARQAITDDKQPLTTPAKENK